MNGNAMKLDNLLTIASLLAMVLLTFHLTDDIVRGFERGGLANLSGMLIVVVWLYAALVLIGTRSGYVILLLGSLLAAGVPILHFRGAGVGGEIAKSSGGFFFIWTLLALGAIGAFSLILSALGLWRLRRGQPAA